MTKSPIRTNPKGRPQGVSRSSRGTPSFSATWFGRTYCRSGGWVMMAWVAPVWQGWDLLGRALCDPDGGSQPFSGVACPLPTSEVRSMPSVPGRGDPVRSPRMGNSSDADHLMSIDDGQSMNVVWRISPATARWHRMQRVAAVGRPRRVRPSHGSGVGCCSRWTTTTEVRRPM